jgi:hypothetical protein
MTIPLCQLFYCKICREHIQIWYLKCVSEMKNSTQTKIIRHKQELKELVITSSKNLNT